MAPAHCTVTFQGIQSANWTFYLKVYDLGFYWKYLISTSTLGIMFVLTYLHKCFFSIWKLRDFHGFFIKILPPVCPLVSWRYAVMSLSPIRFNEAETTILLSFTSMASVDAFLRKQVLNGPRIIDDVIHPTFALLCTYHLWLCDFSYLTISWVMTHAWMI